MWAVPTSYNYGIHVGSPYFQWVFDEQTYRTYIQYFPVSSSSVFVESSYILKKSVT